MDRLTERLREALDDGLRDTRDARRLLGDRTLDGSGRDHDGPAERGGRTR